MAHKLPASVPVFVALPLFGRDLAPRFEQATTFLMAEVARGRVVAAREVRAACSGYADRLDQLRDLGVKVILCGGFGQEFLPLARSQGIEVRTGLLGQARDVLEAFARDGEAEVCRSAAVRHAPRQETPVK